MVFGPDAGRFFFMLFWVGGLGAIFASVCFLNLVRTSLCSFSSGALYSIVKGFAFVWGVALLVVVFWHFGAVPDEVVDMVFFIALVVMIVGIAVGIAGFR